MSMPSTSQKHRARGTALVMAILVSVVITGLVMSLAVLSAAQNAAVANTIRRNAAFYAAEAGAQRAYWQYKHNTTYRAAAGSPLTGSLTMGNGVYGYSVTCIGSGNSVQIVAVATVSTINGAAVSGPAASATYQLTATNMAYVPALQTNNVLDTSAKSGTWNGPVTINGDLMVAKDLNTGKQQLTVNGNVTYGGKLGGGTMFTYSGALTNAANSATTPNYATIEAQAGNPGGTAATPNMTIDFTKISGPNPTYYVTGNLTDPTFIGSGTLIVDGGGPAGANVTFDSATITVGSAGASVYIIAANGNIQIGDPKGASTSATIYGGLYSGKDWDTNTTLNMYGPVEVIGNTNYTGATPTGGPGSLAPLSTLSAATQPWFDTRTPTGTGTVKPSNVGDSVP